MTANYPNTALDAELAYRRELLVAAARPAGRRGAWAARWRRTH
jgi:hypothetical protein